MPDLRQIIIDELLRQKLTRYQLARLSGVSPSRIGEYLAGQCEMGSANLEKLLEALHLDVKPAKAKRSEARGQKSE